MGENATVQGDNRIYMSAKSAVCMEALLGLMTRRLAGGYKECELLVPYSRGDIVSYLNDNALVHETEYREDGVYIKANMSVVDAGRYREFMSY
jgi:GTP-binding protein HflX